MKNKIVSYILQITNYQAEELYFLNNLQPF